MANVDRHRILRLAVVALLAGLAFGLYRPPAGRADAGCDLYASPNGSDGAPGTASEPLRSPQQLADSLSSGQVGCFMAGTFDSSGEGIKVTTPGITLTSAPGTRATIIGRWWIAEGADDVTVSHLNLDGRNDAGQAGPVVNAANTHFDDVDVTNEHTVICFILGSSDYGVAVGTVIENSRIHDCGVLPPQNHDHGIYVEDSRDVVIRNNWIYDNADRGIQLYPQAVGTQIYGNVIDGNGQGVIFSGEGDQASSDNVVEHNVISDSRVRWNAESYWGGVIGSGNVLRNNCVWGTNADSYYDQNGGVQTKSGGAAGFTASGNVVANPQFVDRAGKDFTLQPGSPCGFTQGGAATTAVTLEKHQRVVSSNSPLVLTGYANPEAGSAVTVLRWRSSGWQLFAKRRLRPDGSFVVRKKLCGVRGAARLRATVPGVGVSRVVRVKVRAGAGSAGPAVGLGAARAIAATS